MLNKFIESIHYRFKIGQIYNRLRYEFFVKKRPEVCRYHPIWLQLYVTSRCTFNCKFCTNHAVNESGKIEIGYHHKTEDMSLDLFKTIVDKFYDATVCTFCGVGEPFLNVNLLNMIALAKNKRMITEVVTNGSLLSESNINQLLDGGLDKITISLNESDRERHKFLVNAGGVFFDQIINNIKILVNLRNKKWGKVEIKISRVLTKSTLRLAEEFILLGINLGVDKVIFHNLIFSNIKGFDKQECLFDEFNTAELFNKLADKYGKSIDIEFPKLINIHPEEVEPRCPWYWKNIGIDADGNVSGCGRFMVPKRSYGNFLDIDIWNNKYFRDMRKLFLTNQVLDCCRGCVENCNAKKGNYKTII